MDFKDYYKVLGVARDASQEEIQKAYRKLARKHHPDVSKEKGAETRFKEVSEANEVLKDPEKRARYDQLGADWKQREHAGPQPGAGGFAGFADGIEPGVPELWVEVGLAGQVAGDPAPRIALSTEGLIAYRGVRPLW